jgi:ParB-like chromosome segregation protein Spo0J
VAIKASRFRVTNPERIVDEDQRLFRAKSKIVRGFPKAQQLCGPQCSRLQGVFVMRNAEEVAVADIHVPENRRALDSAKVEELAVSIQQLGLFSPIGIRRHGDAPAELVWGAHRLAATVSLGLRTISAISVDAVGWDRGHREDLDDFVKMAEISENLHRSDLTTQERSEQLATWVELLERTRPISDAEQPNSRKPGPKPSRAIAEVSRATGLSTKTIKQAIASTKLSPAVKTAAHHARLNSKQRLAISRLPETDQLEAITKIARTKNRAGPRLPNQQLGVMSNSLVTPRATAMPH